MIEKKIHLIWWSGTPGEKEKKRIDSIREFNPDYEIKIWDFASILKFVYDCFPDLVSFFKSIPNLSNDGFKSVKKSDFARFLILEVCGGWYLDTDIQMYGSIDSIFSRNVLMKSNEADIHEHDLSHVKAPNYNIYSSILFFDTAMHDDQNRKGVMTAFMGHKANSGMFEHFVRSRIGSESEPVLNFCCPTPLANYIKSSPFKLQALVLPRTYVDFNDRKDIQRRPSWNISDHLQDGSWTDKALDRPYMA